MLEVCLAEEKQHSADSVRMYRRGSTVNMVVSCFQRGEFMQSANQIAQAIDVIYGPNIPQDTSYTLRLTHATAPTFHFAACLYPSRLLHPRDPLRRDSLVSWQLGAQHEPELLLRIGTELHCRVCLLARFACTWSQSMNSGSR